MTEFEPQTSGMESDRSTNCATTTALWTNDYLSIIFFRNLDREREHEDFMKMKRMKKKTKRPSFWKKIQNYSKVQLLFL